MRKCFTWSLFIGIYFFSFSCSTQTKVRSLTNLDAMKPLAIAVLQAQKLKYNFKKRTVYTVKKVTWQAYAKEVCTVEKKGKQILRKDCYNTMLHDYFQKNNMGDFISKEDVFWYVEIYTKCIDFEFYDLGLIREFSGYSYTALMKENMKENRGIFHDFHVKREGVCFNEL